jgi:O-antigen/teichoic acid export membrane protein
MKKSMSVRRLANASLFNVVYLVAQSLIFVFLTPITLKALGDNLYGIWTIFLGVIGFASLTNFKIASTAMKFVSQFSTEDVSENDLSIIITFGYMSGLVLGLLAFLIIFGSRFILAERISENNVSYLELADTLSLLAFSVIPLFLSEVSHGILLGLVSNKLNGALVTLHHLLLWSGALLVGLLEVGAWYLGVIMLVVFTSRFLTSTIAVGVIMRTKTLKIRLDQDLVRRMIKYTFGAWLGGVGMLMFNSLDKVIVGIILGPATAGAYGIATSVALRLSMLADQFTQVLVPFASSYNVQGRQDQIVKVYRHSSRLVACLMVLIAGLLSIWMKLILSLWISPEFSEKYFSYFILLVGCYAVFSMFRPAHQISLGLGWVTIPNAILFGGASSMLVGLWLLSKGFGLSGAIGANIIFTMVILINFYLAFRFEIKMITVIQDIGYPLLVLVPVMVISILDLSNVENICTTIILSTIIAFLALDGGRKKIIANLFKTREENRK